MGQAANVPTKYIDYIAGNDSESRGVKNQKNKIILIPD